MTAPRPLSAPDRAALEATIRERWPHIVREARALPSLWVWFREDGTLDAGQPVGGGGAVWAQAHGPSALRAVAMLADELEGDPNLCLEIERAPGQPPRVLGWATTEVGGDVVRLVALNPWHPARMARDDRIHAERMARREAEAPAPMGNAKLRW